MDGMSHVSNEVADKTIDTFMEMEGKLKNFDFITCMFGMFISSIHILHQAGWTEEELMREVKDHIAESDEL